jgi:hypothetical protein
MQRGIFCTETMDGRVDPGDRRVDRMMVGHELRLFERFSARWQAEHSPLFHPAPQYQYIRHPAS